MKRIAMGVCCLLVVAMAVFSCSKDNGNGITAPDVGTNQVGFINNTSLALVWGIRYGDGSLRVNPGKTSILSYSESGYYVAAAESFDNPGLITISCPPGGTIEAYETGNEIKTRIKH